MTDNPSDAERLVEPTLDRLWELLLPLGGRVRAIIRAYAADNFALSVEQFQILRLVKRGRRSVSELAEEKRISRPAISQAVEALVQRGLLTRIPSTQDRRCNYLELTPQGQALLEAIFQYARSWMAAHLQNLGQADLAAAIYGLEIIHQAFSDEPA